MSFLLLVNGQDHLLLTNGVDALLLSEIEFVPGDDDPFPVAATFRESTSATFRESTYAKSREA